MVGEKVTGSLQETLTNKAKTTNAILIYVHDAKGFIGLIPNQGEKLVEYGQKQWISVEDAVEAFRTYQIEELTKLWNEIEHWIQRYDVDNYPFSNKRVETLSSDLVKTIIYRKMKELSNSLVVDGDDTKKERGTPEKTVDSNSNTEKPK